MFGPSSIAEQTIDISLVFQPLSVVLFVFSFNVFHVFIRDIETTSPAVGIKFSFWSDWLVVLGVVTMVGEAITADYIESLTLTSRSWTICSAPEVKESLPRTWVLVDTIRTGTRVVASYHLISYGGRRIIWCGWVRIIREGTFSINSALCAIEQSLQILAVFYGVSEVGSFGCSPRGVRYEWEE